MRFALKAACFCLLLASISPATAQLRGKDRDVAKKMLYQTLYLRTDVPTNDAVESFIEISPNGYSWERLVSLAEANAKKKGRRAGVYWAFRPNDTVKWGSPDYKDNTITVWFEGVRDELKIRFIEINTLEDFKKAFNHIFSIVPLQDEVPDWPADIKTAIAERRLIEGMTKKQASCVVGTPLKTETGNESGTFAEIWYPRRDTEDRRHGQTSPTGLPSKLYFVGDRLTKIET